MEIADHNKPVAENIMRIIREKGLKQTFVAKNAGYTPQMLNDITYKEVMQFETYKHRDHRWGRERHGYIICRRTSKDCE